jgi:hydroxymethylbilane synthase
MEILPVETMVPAVGQGALALELRAADSTTAAVISAINDPDSFQGALAERTFLKTLGGGCQTPIAAYARMESGRLTLAGIVFDSAGKGFRAVESGPTGDAEAVGARLGKRLIGHYEKK